ncbi:hypothetical protein TNCV_4367351 [Trichonephila clavipes]|nr:hypothetical protein TNCV_4367351 [Trichonephila clavipes]
MVSTRPLRSGDQTFWPIVPTYQWSRTTGRRAGANVKHSPMRGDWGRESDPLVEFKGVGSDLDSTLDLNPLMEPFYFSNFE